MNVFNLISSSLSLRVTQAFIGLLITAVISRKYGDASLAFYALLIAQVNIYVMPIQSTLGVLAARQISKYRALGQSSGIVYLLEWLKINYAIYVLLLISVIIAMYFMGHVTGLSGVLLGAILIVVSLSKVISGTLRGVKLVIVSQSSDVARNIILLLILLYSFENQISSSYLSAIYLVSSTIVVCILIMFFRQHFDFVGGINTKALGEWKWYAACITFFSTNGFLKLLDSSLVILADFIGSKNDVAIFFSAYQLSLIVAFGVSAASMSLAPYFTSLHARAEKIELSRVVRKSLIISLMLGLLVYSSTLIFFDLIIEHWLNKDASLYKALYIVLGFAMVVQSSTGPLAALLSATGNEKYLLFCVVTAGLFYCLSIFLFMHYFGLLGIAYGWAMLYLVLNILLVIVVKSQLRISIV